ncbi:MAG: transcription termination factor NusA [Anaerolineae bacterium]|nr:transcription termination factor NusA [Anaerolineae bacterium]
MNSELIRAINQISAEKELSKQVILEAIEAALVSAYRKNFGSAANVTARIDPETGEMHVYAEKTVVEKVEDPRTQIALRDARKANPKAELGHRITIESTPADFGRIAAQTAKQVILQRIKEAERETVYQYFEERVGEIVQGKVQSIDYTTGTVIVNLDRAEGIMSKEDQIPTERYRPGHSVRALLVEITRGNRGPIIKLSRSHRNLLRRLLEKEIPEIFQGTVEIKAIAREPGQRSKVAVAALQPGIDPVGSCVGMRGTRIQAIVNELSGEKIDIIEWSPDTATFIANALSPAKVTDVILEDTPEGRTAIVIVPDRQLSLAIGKEGQNARLVAKLTGWRIDIKSESEAAAEGLDRLAIERRRMAEMLRASGERDLLAVAEEILRQTPPSAEEALRAHSFYEALEAELTQPTDLTSTSEAKQEVPHQEKPGATAEPMEAERPSPPTKMAEAAVEKPTVASGTEAEAAEEPVMELEDEFLADVEAFDDREEDEDKRRKSPKKEKKRTFIYDEDVGKMIVVRRRKRARRDWEAFDEEYDF